MNFSRTKVIVIESALQKHQPDQKVSRSFLDPSSVYIAIYYIIFESVELYYCCQRVINELPKARGTFIKNSTGWKNEFDNKRREKSYFMTIIFYKNMKILACHHHVSQLQRLICFYADFLMYICVQRILYSYLIDR